MTPTRQSPELHDAIQEAVIDRARAIGCNARALSVLTGGKVSEEHIRRWLERRTWMTTFKAQHVLRAMGLEVSLQQS